MITLSSLQETMETLMADANLHKNGNKMVIRLITKTYGNFTVQFYHYD